MTEKKIIMTIHFGCTMINVSTSCWGITDVVASILLQSEDLLSWPKSSFEFLSKNRRHVFSFLPRTWLNNLVTILFYYPLPFFRQPHNSVFPKLFIFLSKELFQVPFIVFQGIEIVSIKENFIKTKINEHQKVQRLVNTADESELPSQAVTIFAWSSKKHAVLCHPDGRLCVFC